MISRINNTMSKANPPHPTPPPATAPILSPPFL
jgi:hypothetical protein